MAILHAEFDSLDTAPPSSGFDRGVETLSLIALAWLLVVGLWSGPSLGATLVYPNGLLFVEAVLAILLVVQAVRGRHCSPRSYPFLWPSIAVLAICAVSTGLRLHFHGTDSTTEFLRLWRNGEPMLRGLLIFLTVAGNPRALRVAWISLLVGMALQAGAAVLQHITHVSRWYVNLDVGWAGGWQPTNYDPLAAGVRLDTPPRVQGLTSYINLTAAMLAASIPFWATPLVKCLPRKPWGRLAMAAGGTAMVAGLWYTNSRGPMLAIVTATLLLLWRLSTAWRLSLLAGFGAFLLVAWPATPWWALSAFLVSILLALLARRRNLRYLWPVVAGLALAGGIQTLDAYVLHYPLTWRVSESGLGDGARRAIYGDGIHAALSSPWYGIGDAEVAWRVLNLPTVDMHRLPKVQLNYHNQYIHWAAAEGIPVALACTLLICWAVIWCWRRSRTTTDPLPRALALAAAVGLTAFLICNLVDAHFWRIEGGGFFWSLIAVTAAGVKQ